VVKRSLFIVALLFAPVVFAQSADVSVLKTASPEPVAAGGTLTYTISVSSEGPDDASNVVLTDPLPPGVLFQSVSPNAGWICTTPAANATGTLTCSTATFAPGTVEFSLVTTVSPSVSDGTHLTNVATVSSTTADPLSNNNSSETTSTVAAPPGATLNITKSGSPDPVTAGTDLTYTITASNDGGVDVDVAAVRDPLPASTTFVSVSAPAGWSCTTPPPGSGGTVTCSDSSPMPPSTSAAFTLVVHVDPSAPAGGLTNEAFFDATISGRSTTISTSVMTQVVVSADLSVSKSDSPDPVAAGGNITYTIGVTNAGPSDASSPMLSDTIPASTSFVSITSPAGWSCSGTSTITCGTASMAPSTALFQLVVKAGFSAAGTTVSNTATVSSASDTNTANNSATATTAVSLVPTTTAVSVSPSAPYLGQTVTFTANVIDGSFTPAGTVQFNINALPVGSPVILVGGAATYSTSTLPPGTYTVSADYSGGGGSAPSSGSAPPFTVASITISQIPLLGARELLMLALLLAGVAIVTLKRV
jgi:uncharacterized repeat protein (TIGR01451 family)